MSGPIFGVGASGTVNSASGGKINKINNLGINPITVASANPSRKKITFHNPGTVDIYVGPQFTQNNNTNEAFVPSLAALGGCFLVFANGGTLVIEGECQGQWQALAAGGVTNPLTVMDTNV